MSEEARGDLAHDLCEVQSELKAPKGNYNQFAKFRYRKCEDILEAVKPLLLKRNIAITLDDDILLVGTWVFLKTTVTIRRGSESISVCGFARHAEERKGMDDAQVTGSSSSYARKYALAGMFAINDESDLDETAPGAPVLMGAPGRAPGMPPGVTTHNTIPGLPGTK